MSNGLRRLDGVADVLVDLQANHCELIPSPDRTLPLQSIGTAVSSAGFRPGRIFVRARGATRRAPDGSQTFQIDGWPDALPLIGDLADPSLLLARYEDEPAPRFFATATFFER